MSEQDMMASCCCVKFSDVLEFNALLLASTSYLDCLCGESQD